MFHFTSKRDLIWEQNLRKSSTCNSEQYSNWSRTARIPTSVFSSSPLLKERKRWCFEAKRINNIACNLSLALYSCRLRRELKASLMLSSESKEQFRILCSSPTGKAIIAVKSFKICNAISGRFIDLRGAVDAKEKNRGTTLINISLFQELVSRSLLRSWNEIKGKKNVFNKNNCQLKICDTNLNRMDIMPHVRELRAKHHQPFFKIVKLIFTHFQSSLRNPPYPGKALVSSMKEKMKSKSSYIDLYSLFSSLDERMNICSLMMKRIQ